MQPGLHVLLTGASGLIGTAVAARGAELGWRVVPLRRMRAAGGMGASWDPAAGQIELAAAGPVDAVIHLAGETVAQRWTAAARRRIYDSRVHGTALLGRGLQQLAVPPRVVIAA